MYFLDKNMDFDVLYFEPTNATEPAVAQDLRLKPIMDFIRCIPESVLLGLFFAYNCVRLSYITQELVMDKWWRWHFLHCAMIKNVS